MEDLIKTWQKAEALTRELRALTEPVRLERIREQLATEARNRRRWLPFTYAFVAVMTAGLLFFYWRVGAIHDLSSGLGAALVALAGLVLLYFIERVKIPYDAFAYDQPTETFFAEVKAKLLARRRSTRLGLIAQLLLLTAGLYLLIFSGGADGGSPGLFFGSMFGVGGAAIGGMEAAFRWQYRQLLDE